MHSRNGLIEGQCSRTMLNEGLSSVGNTTFFLPLISFYLDFCALNTVNVHCLYSVTVYSTQSLMKVSVRFHLRMELLDRFVLY